MPQVFGVSLIGHILEEDLIMGGIYENVLHQGITIAEWCKILNNEFSQYELYRMITEGANLRKLASAKGD